MSGTTEESVFGNDGYRFQFCPETDRRATADKRETAVSAGVAGLAVSEETIDRTVLIGGDSKIQEEGDRGFQVSGFRSDGGFDRGDGYRHTVSERGI